MTLALDSPQDFICKGFTLMSFDPKTLKYNDAGLIPAIAQDADSGEVLMMAWMNASSVQQTLETGDVTYWSRSRQEFWVKGATSGNTQNLVTVRQIGPACHTGRRTCFYTEVQNGAEVILPEAPPTV
jgi:phosphoribosyl-AMP cyclohydrolase